MFLTKEGGVAKGDTIVTVNLGDEVKAALAKAAEGKAPEPKKIKSKKKPDVISDPAQPWSETEQPIAQPVAVKKHQAVGTVMITNPDGTTSTVEEKVGEPKFFAEPPCTVGVGAKLKMQIVKYEVSAEAWVSLTVPCAATEIDDVADFAQNWVDKRMQDASEKLQQAKHTGNG